MVTPISALRCRRAPLEAVQAVAIEAVMPIFKAMVEAAEDIILRLHSEGFADEGQQGMTEASAYMQALTTHLTHCRSVLALIFWSMSIVGQTLAASGRQPCCQPTYRPSPLRPF